jgi:tape measure domain-containing protein
VAKQVQDILVTLGIEGYEELAKLKSAFRGLDTTVQQSDAVLEKARKAILDYGKQAQNSEATLKGLEAALKGVRGQATLHSPLYTKLTQDIKEVSKAQRDYIADLNSTVSAHKKLEQIEQGAIRRAQKIAAIQQLATAADPLAVAGRRRTEFGDVPQVGRGPKGVFIAPPFRSTEYSPGTQYDRPIGPQPPSPLVQAARSARESARAMADAFSSPELLSVLNYFDAKLGALPNTAAGFAQKLSELQQVLANTTRSSENYATAALNVARVQREASAATQGLGAALIRDLNTGVAARSSKNLQEVISQLQAEMNELDTTTAQGSRRYAENANQVRGLQGELRELGNSYRHVADMATQAATAQQNAANAVMRNNYFNRAAVRQQEEALRELGQRVRTAVAGTPLALPAAGQTSAPGTGQAMSGGARRLRGQVEYTFQDPINVGGGRQVPNYLRDPRYAQLRNQQTTAATGVSPAVGFSGRDPSIQRAIPAYKEAQQELSKVLLSSNNTIQSLEKQRSAWNALRSAIDPASSTFANATKRVQELDKRLDSLSAKQQKVQKRGLGAQGLTQIAGAAISGGIFGGPEGFLGGVAGGALGGVGGAFAGAAIGAQVAGLRQAAGAAAEYAAAINQQRRALSGVVEDSAAYQQSLAFIDQTSRALAIPQEQVTRNFTRLSASVLGAGGDVAAAQEAFAGIAAGIRGTGGSLADLDAALLATAQVFSKGKVSAEELRGQIGERLPGAFTLFAESIGKTPAELDKMLEKGQVSLNDFMAFVRLLSSDYGKQALAMAASSEAAGDRLATAWGRMQEAIGKAIQPIGAEFQDMLSGFAQENEALLVDLAKSWASSVSVVVDFGRAVAAVLAAASRSIAGVIAVVAELRRQVLEVVQAWITRWNAMTAFITSSFNTAGDAIANRLGFLSTAFRVVADFIQNVFTQAFGAIGNRWKETVRNMVNNSTPLGWLAQLAGLDPGKAVVAGMEAATISSAKSAAAKAPELTPSTIKFSTAATADGGSSKGTSGPKPPEDRTPELRAQFDLLVQIGEYEDRIRDLQRDGRDGLALETELFKELAQIEAERVANLRSTNYEGERAYVNAIAQAKIVDARRKNEDAIRQLATERFKQELQNREAVRSAGEDISNYRKQQEMQLTDAREYLRLVQEGMLPAEAQRIIQFERAVTLKKEELDTQIAITEAAIAEARAANKGISTVELQRSLTELQRRREAVVNAAAEGPGRAATNIERMQAGLAATTGSLNELSNLGNIVVTSANNIGDAFGDAFNKLITGAGSAKQVLADFFQSVANSFFKMAQEIIGQLMVMITLQAVGKIFGLAGSAAGASGPTSFSADNPVGDFSFGAAGPIPAEAKFPTFAKGGIFAPQGHLERYAKGGIVNQATMFRFAKGGSFAPGVMGEAGPEAILPLQRTPSGDLGVRAVPYMRGQDKTPLQVPFRRQDEDFTTGSTEGTIRFESTVINSQEFVTRDEAERIGQAAASRGAQIAQRRMKNNPQVRRSLGIA